MAPFVVFVSLFALTTSMTSGDWSPSGSVSSFSHHEDLSEYSTTAYINVTYVDPVTGRTIREKSESGKFGESHIGFASGVLVHVLSGPDNSGCSLPFRSTSGTGELPQEPWVALVRRGGCNFQVKVDNAYQSNASGVIVYNDRESEELEKMRLSLRGKRRPLAAVFTSRDKGQRLAALLDAGTRVTVELTVARHCAERLSVNSSRPSKYQPGPFMRDLCGWNMPYYECAMLTSVLFVSISFVVLMLISLAWLVFYYVQRFRYIHAKDRLSASRSSQDSLSSHITIIDYPATHRRLCSAAKKALSKIPTKHIKHEDKGEGECCAICIEPYRTSEVVRILPCRHEFHRSCIDPWLVEHRTCPMCKMDILKHYGFVFTGSQESILHMDIEEVVSVGESESLRRQRSRSLSPAPFTHQTTQLQLSLDEEGQMSRSPSPNELTPSLPPLTPRPASVSHTVCVDDPIVPNAGLRRSLSLDDCS